MQRRQRVEQVGDSDWLTRCTASGMLLCACPQCRVRLIVTGLLLCASRRSKPAAQYHISPPANSESERAREIRERERERERAERALLGQLHFPRQSEATRTKVSRLVGLGATGVAGMQWGTPGHTAWGGETPGTHTHTRGLDQTPRSCWDALRAVLWDAPRCCGVHHGESGTHHTPGHTTHRDTPDGVGKHGAHTRV